MAAPDFLARVAERAQALNAEREDRRARMRAEMPGCAELIDELTRAFGERPSWVDLTEGGKRVTAGRRGWFRRNVEHQPTIPGAQT